MLVINKNPSKSSNSIICFQKSIRIQVFFQIRILALRIRVSRDLISNIKITQHLLRNLKPPMPRISIQSKRAGPNLRIHGVLLLLGYTERYTSTEPLSRGVSLRHYRVDWSRGTLCLTRHRATLYTPLRYHHLLLFQVMIP